MERELKALDLNSDGGVYIPTPLDNDRENIIRSFIQDVFIMGPPCNENECGFFFELLKSKQSIQSFEGILLPEPNGYQSETGDKLYISLNRCTNLLVPMQLDSFQPGDPTPKRTNLCPQQAIQLPFSLKGVPLQSTAQKLIINLISFMDKLDENQALWVGSSMQRAGIALGMDYKTVLKVNANWQRNEIKTPGKKRPASVPPVLSQFDSFRIEHVKRIVQRYYNNNSPPLLGQVFEDLKNEIAEEQQYQRDAGRIVKPFQCSINTFRKLMHNIGFHYGRINNRDVILMRDDIVARRWNYLEALRRNQASANPKPVICTDETWIDPFARTGKAWMPRKCSSFRERAKYSYKRNKISRGPRIIILHAGGEDGFLDGAMRVYPVAKKKASVDYHDNVNGEFYVQWFTDVLKSLKDLGPHIIVIDNAPYHSRTQVPKSSDRKQVLYDWLKENLEEPQKSALKSVKDYLKPQLWSMIKDMKATGQYYIIDRLAAKYGHQILRLPPYNW